MPLFFIQSSSRKRTAVPPTDGQRKTFRDLLMFLLSLCERAVFQPRLPDERLRIISEPDLIYVPSRWGHPNDLPRRGRHQSPPTRGHSKHAWERERGGTPKHPQGCLCMGTCARTLCKCILCACVCACVYEQCGHERMALCKKK